MAGPTLLTYGQANIDETLTLSMTNMIPGIRDNVFNSNNTLKWFTNNGKVKKKGGTSLSHGLMYGTNTTAAAYQRYDVLDVTPQDGLTRDQWTWAQYAVSQTIDGFTERIANAGDSALADALDEKKMQAEESLSRLIEGDFFVQSNASKSMRTLATIVLDSGTEGQVSATTSTWWKAVNTTSGSWAAQGRSDLTTLVNTLSIRNPGGMPEVLLSDQNAYEFYESSLVSQYRYTDNTPDIGAKKLLFKEIPWIWSNQATSGVIYALHSKAIEFIVNSDTDFIVTPFVKPANQDARTSQILFAAALTTGVRRKLGKLNSVTA